MRKRRTTRSLAVAAATLALLLLCAGVYQVSAADDDDSITTTLHPGWNLIGWIHEAAPASALFDQLAGLNLIHDGDERSARRDASDDPAPLQTLQPGRGYWLYIDSEQPVAWTRPAEPVTRRFHLEPGEQLVAWTGPSDRSIADVLLGLRDQLTVAWRWVAADQRFIPWSPNPDRPVLDMPAINRGEAVQINLVEGTEWLHPTGDLPQLQFAGGLSHLPRLYRGVVEADLRFVVERFVARLGVEVPAERLHIRIPTTPEAHERLKAAFHTFYRAWASSPDSVGGTSVVVIPWTCWPTGEAELASAVPGEDCGTLAHEYFHIVQHELAGQIRERVPGWLLEGTAMWAEDIVYDRTQADFYSIQSVTNALNLAAYSGRYDYHHYLGQAATALLIERSGDHSIVDIWRNLGELDVRAQPWQLAFAETFGISFADFTADFYEQRRPLFTVLTGHVTAIGARTSTQLHLEWDRLNVSGWFTDWEAVPVRPGEAFTINLMRSSPSSADVAEYHIRLLRRGTRCGAAVGPDGEVVWGPVTRGADLATVRADAASIDGFEIQLPEEFCERRLNVQLVGSYAVSGSFSVVFCVPENTRCSLVSQRADGVFAEFVPFVRPYQIRVYDLDRRCDAYAAAEGFTSNRAGARLIEPRQGSTSLRLRLDSPTDLCRTGR